MCGRKKVNTFEELVKELTERNIKKQAQMIIKHFWDKCRTLYCTSVILQKFLDQNVNSIQLSDTPFETIVETLKKEEVISSTKNMLHRVHRMCAYVHGSPPTEGPNAIKGIERVNIRVVISAFMIVANPLRVFGQDLDTLAEELKKKATELVECFEFIINEFKWVIDSGGYHNQYMSDRNSSATQKFIRILYEYHHRFNAWKIPDEAKLVARIISALSALYNARNTILDGSSENSHLLGEFAVQINRLTGKLIQIGGRDKLKEFEDDMLRNHGIQITTTVTNGNATFETQTHFSTFMASKYTKMSNEMLAHELLLDPTFLLVPDLVSRDLNSQMKQVSTCFRNAFWNQLKVDLSI